MCDRCVRNLSVQEAPERRQLGAEEAAEILRPPVPGVELELRPEIVVRELLPTVARMLGFGGGSWLE
jgi:hypothetical protein